MNKKIFFIFSLILISMIILTSCSNNDNLKRYQESLKIMKNISEGSHSSEHYKINNDEIGAIFKNYKLEVFRKVNKNQISCISGNCPSFKQGSEYFSKIDCKFCKDITFLGDTFSSEQNQTISWEEKSADSCTTKYTLTLPSHFFVINKSKDKVIAKGFGHGLVKNQGPDCNNPFEYKLKTDETWIFTIGNPGVEVIAEEDGPLKAHAIYRTVDSLEIPYSKNALIVTCKSSFFKTKPDVELVARNGKEIPEMERVSLLNILRKPVPDKPSSAKFVFTSFYNGTYEVQPICYILDDQTEVSSISSSKSFSVSVYGSSMRYYPLPTY